MKELAKKAIKKVAAIGMGAAMLGSTIAGAVAVDLNNYPEPFVKEGVFNGEIVVGTGGTAAGIASDIIGSIDIAASLQYAMKTAGSNGAVSSEGGIVTVKTGGAALGSGVKIESTGDALNMGEKLNEAKTTAIDDDDLPVVLADGEVKDDDESTGIDYTQKINLPGDAVVKFGRSDDQDAFGEVPGVYLDVDETADVLYNVTVDFQGTIDATALDDSESIVIAGKEYTFKPDQEVTGNLILLGSDETQVLELGESVEIEGVEYTLLGANAENNDAILKVGSSQKTVTEGTSYTIGGVDVYVKSLYITTIPTTSASIEIFIGSEELEIPAAYDTVEVNDEEVEGVKARYFGTNTTDISEIVFSFTPIDIDADGEEKFVKVGEDLVDPLFGTFKLAFTGQSVENEASSRSEVAIERVGDDVKLSFANKDGDDQEITLYQYTSGDVLNWADDLATSGTTIADDEWFVAENGADVYSVYQLYRVYKDGTSYKAEFKTSDGSSIDVLNTSSLEDVGTINIDYVNKQVTLSSAIVNLATGGFTIENDAVLNFTAYNFSGTGTFAKINFTEYSSAAVTTEGLTADTIVTTITADSASDKELELAGAAMTATSTENEDSDEEFVVTEVGTYATWGSDDDNDGYMNIFYTEDPVEYSVYLAPTDAASSDATVEYTEGDVLEGIGEVVAVTAGSVTGGAYNINKVPVPLAKLDTDATLGSTNQVIVGGPAVNKLSAEALGLSYPTYGAQSGLFNGEGEAVLKLVEQGSNVALLVAGWEAEDTQRASIVLANYEDYSEELTGMEVKVTGTIASPQITLAVEEEEEVVEEVAEEVTEETAAEE